MNKTNIKEISKIQSWVLASRPKTLPAAIVPVLVGTAIAFHDGLFRPFEAIIALICSLLIQIATNFVNDLYDYLAGSDTADRKGPIRVLATGLITEKEMRYGIALCFGITFLLGLFLVYKAGYVILIIGILSMIAGYAYTAGPYPLAYNALGDVFVFIFFGFVATVGTYYVQALQVTHFVFWASIPVGALITNILVVNNYRDIDEDKSNGKITLAVKIGRKFTRIQYVLFMILSYIVPFVAYFTYKQNFFILLPLISFPYSLKLIKMVYNYTGEELNQTLALTAKLSGIYGLLFAIGILV